MPDGIVMKVAIPCWRERISPVFDRSGRVLLIEIEDGREKCRKHRTLTRTDAVARAGELLAMGADVLICGAISAPLEFALSSAHVEVNGFLCGPVEEILAAYLSGELANPAFEMPGTRRQRSRQATKVWSSRGGRGAGDCGCPAGRGTKTAHGVAGRRRRIESPECGAPVRELDEEEF